MTADPVSGSGLPVHVPGAAGVVPGQPVVPGLSGPAAVAGRVRLPDVRSHAVLADGAGLWMCRACGRHTSVTAGTIFHRTRTPLSTWFAAIWFLTSQKNGMSAQGLQRVLGFGSYETAWAWLHKLRRPWPGPGSAVRDRRGRRDDGRRRHPGSRGGHRQGRGDDRGGTQRRPPSRPGPARRRRPPSHDPWSTAPPR